MEKKANNYDIEWDKIPGTLARYPLLMYYANSKLCPVDKMGFRLIDTQGPLEFLKNKNTSDTTYVCIGGSTTFGWFVDYEFSFPAQLERSLNKSVLNLGIPGLDIKNCLEILMQVLRYKTEKLVLIFLFGINEKSGFIQMNDLKSHSFKTTHNLFSRLEKKSVKSKFRFPLVIPRNRLNISDERYSNFLVGQIDETNSYILLIKRLCNALDIQSYFILQPHGLNFLHDSNSKFREQYLDDLYSGLKTNLSIMDISKTCHMLENDFIDWQHPNASGYKKISDSIYRLLK